LLLELQYLVVPGTGTTTVACTGKYLGLRRLKRALPGVTRTNKKPNLPRFRPIKLRTSGLVFTVHEDFNVIRRSLVQGNKQCQHTSDLRITLKSSWTVKTNADVSLVFLTDLCECA
jgi:hypothetical protein